MPPKKKSSDVFNNLLTRNERFAGDKQAAGAHANMSTGTKWAVEAIASGREMGDLRRGRGALTRGAVEAEHRRDVVREIAAQPGAYTTHRGGDIEYAPRPKKRKKK